MVKIQNLLNVEYVVSNTKNLELYLKLYKECFNKYNRGLNYIDWLYKNNPEGLFLGVDIYFNNRLIGQVCGYKSSFNYKGSIKKVIVPVNVCVKKEFRKKNFFVNAVKKFEKLCYEQNIDLIIGIANKSATPGWIRLQYNFLKSLDVFFFSESFGLEKIEFNENIFYSKWDDDKIHWRINNPENKIILFDKNSRLIAKAGTQIPFINVISTFPNETNNKLINLSKNKFNIFLGTIPNINQKMLKLPNVLKKSPLNFIYKDLKNENFILNKNQCFFSFLDFDAF